MYLDVFCKSSLSVPDSKGEKKKKKNLSFPQRGGQGVCLWQQGGLGQEEKLVSTWMQERQDPLQVQWLQDIMWY